MSHRPVCPTAFALMLLPFFLSSLWNFQRQAFFLTAYCLPLFAQFKRTHLSKIPIATHRSKIGSYLSSSGNSPSQAWCIQLKRMQQHESHSLGEEQNESKIPLYFFEMLWTHFKIAPATLLFSFVILAVIFIRNSETIEIQCFACMVFVMKWE